jgi:hypothetical protein
MKYWLKQNKIEEETVFFFTKNNLRAKVTNFKLVTWK